MTCPVCATALPVGDANAGQRVGCPRCSATLLVRVPGPGVVDLAVVGQPSRSWVTEGSVLDNAVDPTASGRPPAAIVDAPGRSAPEAIGAEPHRKGGLRKWLTYGLIGLALLTCGLFLRREFMTTSISEAQRTSLRPHLEGGLSPRP